MNTQSRSVTKQDVMQEHTTEQGDLLPFGKRADVLLRVMPTLLAGGGSVTQTTQIDEWLAMLSTQHGTPVRRIGVAGQRPGFVDEQITGTLYPLDRSIQPAATVTDIYHQVMETLAAELAELYAANVRHFFGVCCGYTSYGLFALHQAVRRINDANPADPITGNVIVQDSSFPDTDTFDDELDQRGYPTTRFHGPSYQSTRDLRVVFTLNGAVPFDVRRSQRAPLHCTNLMTTFPFTPRYINHWQRIPERPHSEARAHMEQVLPLWAQVTAADRVIPFIASGGCWDTGSIGKWMTAEQYDTVIEGTRTLTMALSQVAQHSGRRVVLPIIQQAADVIFAWELPAVCHIEQSAPESGSVAVLPYDTLPQASFTNLMLCANLVINRSIQSNAFAETLIARLPQLVMTIPAAGYMDAELMAESMPLGHFRYNQPVEALAAEITRLLDDSAYREQSGGSLWSLFDRMYASPETNFGHVLARFAGVAGEKLHKL